MGCFVIFDNYENITPLDFAFASSKGVFLLYNLKNYGINVKLLINIAAKMTNMLCVI